MGDFMKKQILKNKKFIESIEDLKNGNYTLLSDYLGRNETINGKRIRLRISLRHNKCGYKWNTSAEGFIGSNYKKGSRCPKCQHPNSKRTLSWVKDKVEKLGFGEYNILSTKYIDGKHKLKFQHLSKKCKNYIFEMVPKEFIHADHRCPKCAELKKESKYVKFIKKFFKKYNIKFKQEKYFKKCYNIERLPFDFYLKDYNLLIEYDGLQHKRAWYNSPEKIKKTKINDSIKNKFIKNSKKLKLIRLSCKLETLVDFLHGYFLEEDSTTIERYNIDYIE